MKAVILAGGLGTRLSEETHRIPKPMVEIGGRPIIWHIMKSYSAHGINDFIICLGYKGYVLKEYFANYPLHEADVSIDLQAGEIEFHRRGAEPWRVTLIDTGEYTMTGGRLGRIAREINETFLVTYGDGLSNVDITESIRFHRSHGKVGTVTAVSPPGRFGSLTIRDMEVIDFSEKPVGEHGFINGGYFVFEPEVFEFVSGDTSVLENDVLPVLAQHQQLMAFEHNGFWQPMDTLRDKSTLEEAWQEKIAPWRVW
jgi:glucose-1-phosphate cytidylyltransferase